MDNKEYCMELITSNTLDFIDGDRVVKINKKHWIYSNDIKYGFDYYFNATKPTLIDGKLVVDYSECKAHDVIGYDKHSIYFPSLPEPVMTTKQYLKFADLKSNSVVFDLGAYSGLSSIIFKEEIGALGKVIAVEADTQNLEALRNNFKAYEECTGSKIEFLFGAVWNNNDGLYFSSEGNMGSSAIDVVGNGRGENIFIPSFTLSTIANMFDVSKVDFIKCDIEGAEKVIFEEAYDFFKKFHPKIIVEPHGGDPVIQKVISDLHKYNYICKIIDQDGVGVPLIECE